MKPAVLLKVALALVVVIGLALGLQKYGLLPGAVKKAAAVPDKVTLATEAEVAVTPVDGSVPLLPLPSSTPAAKKGREFRMNVWFWNAQMGLMYANGGPVTTKGSLMEKNGVNLVIKRQDDTEKTKGEMVQFAQALQEGDQNPPVGTHYAIIMGDGAAAFMASIGKLLGKLGPEYQAEIIGAVGYSRGEDGMWGPAEWRDDPQTARGGVCIGVLRDGDWNIAQAWLANNGLKNNPDETTYDPDALNWIAADDYIKAVEMYNTGYSETRPVVKDGKVTTLPKQPVKGQCAVTWTPGDFNLAHGRGGAVRLLSTAPKENPYQMPSVIIGIKKWDSDNRKQVEGMLQAVFDGSDQVRNHEEALTRAAQASYSVYAEQSAAWIKKYYKGTVERDKTQQPVPLGGSAVANLADNLLLFGLAEGTGGVDASIFKASYEGFGHVAQTQYPKLMPDFPKTSAAVNIQFLGSLQQRTAKMAKPEEPTFERVDEITTVVAKRNWAIQFETGKATFTPAAESTLEQLYQQLTVGAGLQVQVDGHTDNVGDAEKNRALSQARAAAVQAYLQRKNPRLFPADRLVVRGLGAEKPLADNATPDGRAKNRRVEIILGS